MNLITCEAHHCTLAQEACASRHLNSLGTRATRTNCYRLEYFDPICRLCKDGSKRLNDIGIDGVKSYREMLRKNKKYAVLKVMQKARWNRIKDRARAIVMVEARRKKGIR